MTVSVARPASTVVLIRSATPGFEVFLVRRHDKIAFMGGAHVFPGGRVDATDTLGEAELMCDGTSTGASRMPDLSAAEAMAFHIAAIRELFEEAGVLLARDASGAVVTIDGAARIRLGRSHPHARFDAYRAGLAARTITLREIAARERLRLALDLLAPFAHWVTPEAETRRFDTRFFLAIAPEVQEATSDRQETTAGAWMTPDAAIARCQAGELALPPATWTTLRMLARHGSVAEVWQWARSCAVPRVQPALVERNGVVMVMLPGDPACPPLPGFVPDETRFVLEHGSWRPVAAD